MRRFALLSLLLLSGALAVRGAVAHAAAAPPLLGIEPDSVRADLNGAWQAQLLVENRLDTGLYPDSLSLEWTSEDPDSSAEPRRGVQSLNSLVQLMQPISAGEAGGVAWVGPAAFERGSIRFRLVMHDARQAFHVLTSDVRIVGSDLGDRHPSLLLASGRERIEVAILRPDSANGPAPGLLLVPPAGVGARSLLRWASSFARRGHAVAIMSLPGSGRSTGRSDRGGPASVAAVHTALDRLAHDPGVDARRLVVWGQQDGATAALLAAVKHPELQGVISQDASFDPWATWRAWPNSERAAYVSDVGADSASWRARSPLAVATRIVPPVLVLQSEDSPVPVSEPAQAFASARLGASLAVESRLHAATEPRPFRRADALRVAADFMRRRTRQP